MRRGCSKSIFAKFFERKEPLMCGPKVLFEQAWMRLEVFRSAHHQARSGLDTGLCRCDGRGIEKRLLRSLFWRHGL